MRNRSVSPCLRGSWSRVVRLELDRDRSSAVVRST